MQQMDAETPSLYPRFLSDAIREALADTPVVCLLGPRQCGKSTLARSLEHERAYITLDDELLLNAARADAMGFLSRLPRKVTFDEVQRAPSVFLAIKKLVDEDRRPGRFLLTGSANLLQLPRLPDSLAGRMECLFLGPLTEAEKHRRTGRFLRRLLDGDLDSPRVYESPSWDDSLPSRLCVGGYPEPNLRSRPRARLWQMQYIQSVIDRDVRDVARVRDTRAIRRMLEMLAHMTAQLLNVSALASDLGLDRATVERYLLTLERLFLIHRLPAWHGNACKRLVKTPKVHLVDSGLAASLMALDPGDWNAKRDRFGHLLESFVLQQLTAMAGWTDSDVRFWHYRDKDQAEVDLVLTRGSRVWGIEVKASSTLHPSDGKGLRRLAAAAGGDFAGGIVLYDGPHLLPLGAPGLLAVPLACLWDEW